MLQAIRLSMILALLPAAACADPEEGAEHTSALGFTVTLPPAWVALDPADSEANADQLLTDERFSGLDPATFRSALQKVQSGQFEFFFRRPFEGFAQNVAVRERNLNIPADASALSKECDALPGNLRQAYGRNISRPICELRSVVGYPASYIEIEGAIPEMVNLQYQVQRAEGRVLTITATVLPSDLPAVRREFESMVHSMQIESTAP